MPSTVAPGRRRPITRSHEEIGCRSSDVSVPAISGSCCNGTHMSGGSAFSVSPKKPGGVTPATVKACPSSKEKPGSELQASYSAGCF